MANRIWFAALAFICILELVPTRAFADEGDQFHFDFGLTYTSGANKVDKAIKNAYEQSGFTYSSFIIPVGLRLDPYYFWGNGIGVGGGIGPFQLGSVNSYSQYYGIIPVGLDARYEFINSSNVMPYVRGGFRYPISFGDLVHDGRIGGFGALGVEFSTLHFGLEVSVDTSTVRAGFNGIDRRVMPNEIMASIFFHL